MPRGPKGQKRPTEEQKEKAISRWDNEGGAMAPTKRPKRPADVIGNAIRVAQIATGEAEEEYEIKPEKNAAAAELGRKGGRKRAEIMTPERRAEVAKQAARTRWDKS